jgi:hypothetical protein
VLAAGTLAGVSAMPIEVTPPFHAGGAAPGDMIGVVLGVHVGHDGLEGGVTLAGDVGGCPGACQQVVAP